MSDNNKWPEGNYLITGGAGFIGSNLAESIRASSQPVRVADNFITGRRENLEGIEGVDLREGDLRDTDFCIECCEGIDWVLHEAALGSVPRSVDDPVTTNSHNTSATLNMLFAAKQAGVRRLVYAASSSAYGDTPTLPKIETMPSIPLSPYAVSKLVGEMYAKVFYEVYGLKTLSLRYFNIFGRRQDPDGAYAAVIPKFIRKILRNEAPLIHGDGGQSRDFTYIDNVLQANRLALSAPDEALGQTFNVACSSRYTLNELFDKLASLLGSDIRPQYGDSRPGDVRHSEADIGKARNLLGYDPKIDLFEGLERTIDWYREALS